MSVAAVPALLTQVKGSRQLAALVRAGYAQEGGPQGELQVLWEPTLQPNSSFNILFTTIVRIKIKLLHRFLLGGGGGVVSPPPTSKCKKQNEHFHFG